MIITNKHSIDEHLFKAIQQMSARAPSAERLSVTSLIDSPRIRQLTLRHWDDIEDDVSQRMWLVLGISVHALLEEKGGLNDLVEEPIRHDIDGTTISGRADIFTNDGVIKDWKTTSAWTSVFDPRGKKSWYYQMNVYKWLFEKAGFEVNKAKICCIYRDWTRMKARTNKEYPRMPYGEVEYNTGQTETEMYTLMKHQSIEVYIRERVKLHKLAAELKDSDLPVCTPDEKWQNPKKYAVMKGKNKQAMRGGIRNTLEEAREWANAKIASDPKLADLLYIVERPQQSMRCSDYCPVRFICEYREVPDEERILTVEG